MSLIFQSSAQESGGVNGKSIGIDYSLSSNQINAIPLRYELHCALGKGCDCIRKPPAYSTLEVSTSTLLAKITK